VTKAQISRLPETPRQVREWELAKTRYLRRGLCRKCAAQAAWGHQNGAGGWEMLHPPCTECQPLVELLPMRTANPRWRCLDLRKRLRGRYATGSLGYTTGSPGIPGAR
jgi:hypothetical protein